MCLGLKVKLNAMSVCSDCCSGLSLPDYGLAWPTTLLFFIHRRAQVNESAITSQQLKSLPQLSALFLQGSRRWMACEGLSDSNGCSCSTDWSGSLWVSAFCGGYLIDLWLLVNPQRAPDGFGGSRPAGQPSLARTPKFTMRT